MRLIVDFAPNNTLDLIVDFAHRRRSYTEPADVKKTVHFSPLAEVRFYECLHEPDAREQYFNKDDYKKFRKAHQRDLEKAHRISLDLSKSDEDDECTLTGFENVRTPGIMSKTLQRKKDVRRAVLNEQKYQKESGYCDPEMIAYVSRCHSEAGVIQALRFGSVQEDSPSYQQVTRAARSA